MKVHVIKASPRGERAGSSRCADAFIRGLTRGGADVSQILLSSHHIKPCSGCFHCWTQNPGVCIHRDDMPRLLEMEAGTDMVVFATPLYIYSVPGPLKTYLDRRLPQVEPFFIPKDADTLSKHPVRGTARSRHIFVISTAGFPETGHFDALELMFQKTMDLSAGDRFDRIFIGGAELLYHVQDQNQFNALFSLIETAGLEMARDRRMSNQTTSALERIETEKYQNRNEFRKISNAYLANQLPRESSNEPAERPARDLQMTGDERRCRHTDGDMASLLADMAVLYNPNVEPKLQALLQFNFEEEHFFIAIQNGEAVAYVGTRDDADMTIVSPKQIWNDIASGTRNGETALINGEFTVEGDMSYLMKMRRLFPTPSC